MKFIIVDDQIGETASMLDCCGAAYPDAKFIQDVMNPTTFHSDRQVQDFVAAMPNDSETILIIDMCLHDPQSYTQAMEGVKTVRSIRARRSSWTIVAFTGYTLRIKNSPDWKELFDGMIDKADIDPMGREQRITAIRQEIDSAINRRNKNNTIFPAHIKIADSLGMRLFQASFGDDALFQILRNESFNWSKVQVEALTSGFSGAFILHLSGSSSLGQASLIVKAALNANVINNELSALDKYLGLLQDFLPTAHFDKTPRPIGTNGAVYYRQAHVRGITLLTELSRVKWPKNSGVLKELILKYIKFYKSKEISLVGVQPVHEMLKISALDIGRLEDSCHFLFELQPALTKMDLWPANMVDNKRVYDLIAFLRTWNLSAVGLANVLCVVQHGDLNPFNVLVQGEKNFTLIDLGRLGVWPFGYDISRIALLLRMWLLDRKSHSDWLPNNLIRWLEDPICHTSEELNDNISLCPESQYCEKEYLKFTRNQRGSVRLTLENTYVICSFYDVIKLVSYQNISPFKRIWALSEALRLKGVLDAMKFK